MDMITSFWLASLAIAGGLDASPYLARALRDAAVPWILPPAAPD